VPIGLADTTAMVREPRARATSSLCNRLLHTLSLELWKSVSVPAYLTLEEVVERYRNQISEGTLSNWRSKRIGPSFIKIGKAVLYPIEELDRWDRSNLISCRRISIAPFGADGVEGSSGLNRQGWPRLHDRCGLHIIGQGQRLFRSMLTAMRLDRCGIRART
jgi:hypothetical protein